MKPRDPALSVGLGCAGAVNRGPMTSSISVNDHQPPTVPLLQQQQARRHIERPIRVWPFTMECLTETETETDSAEATIDSQPVSNSKPTQQQPTAAVKKEGSHVKKTGQQQQQQSSDGAKKVAEADSVGCAPFFGVKHYLNNFYGIPDDDTTTKVWRQIEIVSEMSLFLSWLFFLNVERQLIAPFEGQWRGLFRDPGGRSWKQQERGGMLAHSSSVLRLVRKRWLPNDPAGCHVSTPGFPASPSSGAREPDGGERPENLDHGPLD